MNEGSGAYLKFRLKKRALIDGGGGGEGGGGGHLIKFPFQQSHVKFLSAKS